MLFGNKEIKKYEKYKSSNESNEKKYVGALLLYSIVLYIIGAVFYFIYLMPKNLVDRMKTLVPFFIMPFMYKSYLFFAWKSSELISFCILEIAFLERENF